MYIAFVAPHISTERASAMSSRSPITMKFIFYILLTRWIAILAPRKARSAPGDVVEVADIDPRAAEDDHRLDLLHGNIALVDHERFIGVGQLLSALRLLV